MELTFKWPDAVPVNQIDEMFIQGCLDRMATSYFKYGSTRAPDWPRKANMLASAQLRINKYLETGNTEWLMDASNYIQIEFMNPAHPDAHFRSTDGDESPGNVMADGSMSTAHERDLPRGGDQSL